MFRKTRRRKCARKAALGVVQPQAAQQPDRFVRVQPESVSPRSKSPVTKSSTAAAWEPPLRIATKFAASWAAWLSIEGSLLRSAPACWSTRFRRNSVRAECEARCQKSVLLGSLKAPEGDIKKECQNGSANVAGTNSGAKGNARRESASSTEKPQNWVTWAAFSPPKS